MTTEEKIVQLERVRAKMLRKTKDIAAQIKVLEEARALVVADELTAEACLMDDIKQDVLTLSKSVKGKSLQAVFVKGRVTWNSKGLEGFAVGNPDILAFRKEGKPSVTFRAVK